ncbi:MAG: flagellar basal body P-ring protein FlgI [Negativicutes bacterium]|nr:flagellar basal body P-ring protein FlgI [Negativicutes bacterium]
MVCKLFRVMAITGLAVAVAAGAVAANATTRIKDIARVMGVRSNQVIGYGLVVGLAGTGDSSQSVFTQQTIANMLQNYGVIINPNQLQTKNIAAVMVTAQLPPFAKSGDLIDVNVSSMGDASSIAGGTLLQTPLKAANGVVYAVAQGPVSIGGYAAGGSGGSNNQRKTFPTAGTIAGGALVERSVPTQFYTDDGTVRLSLIRPDFTTARRVADVINGKYGPGTAQAVDAATVVLSLPGSLDIVSEIAGIEELPVVADSRAKVVINERTGTVVMGSNVTIDAVSVSQGGITLKVAAPVPAPTPALDANGQPVLDANGQPVMNPAPPKQPDKEEPNIILPQSSSVADVVKALNAVGATPKDLIAILQAMAAAGALNAEIQII